MKLSVYGTPVTINRRGEYGSPDRFRYDVKVPSLGVSTWITVVGDDFDRIIETAFDAIDHELGDDTGTEWGLYAEEVRESGGAAGFLVSSIHHYRTVPFTYDPDSEKFGTLGDAVKDFRSAAWQQHEDTGYSWDLYANDSDESTYRLTLGPRGGVSIERH